MNLLLFHVIPLSIMLLNCLSNHWVLWSGTLDIDDIIPVNIDMYWGMYSVDIGCNFLGNSYVQMTIPNFIEFNTNNFDISILKENTLPLYYSVYVLYIVCIIYECANISIGLINYHKKLDHNIIRIYHLVYLNILRIGLSLFFIWAMFTYYGTTSLCLNNFIPLRNDTIGHFQPVALKPNNEICTYGWNAITIIGNELLLTMFNFYTFWIYCNNIRSRSNSDVVTDYYVPITINN